MERRVNVNGEEAYARTPVGSEEPLSDDVVEIERSTTPPGDQGPCLYFGPAGERCSRRAVAGGFCRRHLPGAKAAPSDGQRLRKLIALIAALAVAWPFLEDVIREIARLFK